MLDNLFRFTDYLNTTNDGGEFENNLQDILLNSDKSIKKIQIFETYLFDLQIKIENKKFTTGPFTV